MLIKNVEVQNQLCDVRLDGGRITQIGKGLEANPMTPVLNGQKGALLPGLHDHHIHLNATAAAMNSLKCGPPHIHTQEELIHTLTTAPGIGWLRGVGYHDSVAGAINRDWLDRYVPDRPVRIQHRSGRLWILNSLALNTLEMTTPDDGRLLDDDMAIRAHHRRAAIQPDLMPLIKQLHRFGITGVTEVTPDNDIAIFTHYAKFADQLNLCIMGGADLHKISFEKAAGSPAYVGALKIHNHENALPALDELASVIADAHAHKRPVAIHAVTRAELMLSLAALEEAGIYAGDRIEHAAIADETAIAWMKKLGVIVVTQPHFIGERQAAYRAEVDKTDLPYLWPLGSFLNAGLCVAAGSDSPFGGLNPWQAMAWAISRPADLGADEAISPEQALTLYTKPPMDAGASGRKICVGAQADMCLLNRPWHAARKNLVTVSVKATWVSGRLVYDAISSTKPHAKAV